MDVLIRRSSVGVVQGLSSRWAVAAAYDDRLLQLTGYRRVLRVAVLITGRSDAQAQVFDFQVVFDAVLGTFTAQARRLDAAKWRDFVRDQPGIDADHAVFQRFGNTEHAAHVAGIEVRRQAEFGVVRHGDYFCFVFEAEQRRQWAERFFLGDGGVFRHVGQDGWLEEVAFQALATGEHGRALAVGVRDFQLLGERVVDRVLYVQTVSAHARLAIVAVLGNDGAFDGLIQVCVVEHDERRVAAQFQGDFLDVLGAFGHQLTTDFGRTGERQLAHDRVAGQLAADVASAAGDNAQHAFRDACAVCQLNQCQRRERRLRSRFDHHGATGSQRRARFTGDHRRGEVPRRDRRGDADRLLDHDQAFVGLVTRNHIAIDALGFFGEPLNKGSGVNDLALGFGQWLALFEGHEATEVVLVFDQQFEPATQLVRTLFGSQCTPGWQRLVSGLDGATGFSCAHFWHSPDDFVGSRVVDLDGLTVVSVQPHAVDIGLLAEQRGIFKLHVGLLNSTAQRRSEFYRLFKGASVEAAVRKTFTGPHHTDHKRCRTTGEERLKSQTNPRDNAGKGQ